MSAGNAARKGSREIKHTLRDQLSHHREINITVIGRKSGRRISNPVWFVLRVTT